MIGYNRRAVPRPGFARRIDRSPWLSPARAADELFVLCVSEDRQGGGETPRARALGLRARRKFSEV